MDDLDFLLLIVGLFYFYECAYWARPRSLVFVSFLGGRHRMHTFGGRALLRNDHGGLLLGNLLPLGTSAQAQSWPVSLAPEGVFGWVAQVIGPEGRPRQSERFYRYDDIEKVIVDGQTVRINGAPFVTVCSADLAHALALRIEKLCALPPERREAEIGAALAETFNATQAAGRFRAARKCTFILMLLCVALLLYVFAFIPTALAQNWQVGLLQYVVIYFGLVSMILVHYYAAHQDLLPAETGRRRKQALMMLISPANAMHARNELFRDLLSRYQPLTVAQVLCQPASFRRFARHVLLDLRQPLPPVCPTSDAEACATERWFRERLLTAVLSFLRGVGLDPDQLAGPPAPEAPECRTYCPRCDGQFELEAGVCHCCDGLPLRRFDSPPPPPFPAPPAAPPVETPVPEVKTFAPPPVTAGAGPPVKEKTSRKKRRRK